MIGLRRRLDRLARNHQAERVLVGWNGRHGWKIDLDIWHLGGIHRVGSSYRSLREALKQAERQVPGSTIPVHTNHDGDNRWCRSCSHFRVAHGRDYCRQPGCPCLGFEDFRTNSERTST